MKKWIPKFPVQPNPDLDNLNNINDSNPFKLTHPGKGLTGDIDMPDEDELPSNQTMPEVIVYIIISSDFNQFIEYNNRAIREMSKNNMIYVFSINDHECNGIYRYDGIEILPDDCPQNVKLIRASFYLYGDIILPSVNDYFVNKFTEIKECNDVKKLILCNCKKNDGKVYNYKLKNINNDFFDIVDGRQDIINIITLANEILEPIETTIFSYSPNTYFNCYAARFLNEKLSTFSDRRYIDINSHKLKDSGRVKENFNKWMRNFFYDEKIKVFNIYSSYNSKLKLCHNNLSVEKLDIKDFCPCEMDEFTNKFVINVLGDYPDIIELYDFKYCITMNIVNND